MNQEVSAAQTHHREELNPEHLTKAAELLQKIRAEVNRIYVGGEEALNTLLVALLARGHVLLEGVPGVAKTTLAKAFAHTLGCDLRRVQFTPDLLPSDITGTYVLDPRSGDFSLRKGPLFANIVLADEINRAPAKTQSALLEAMQEGQVTIEGERQALPSPFMVLATQNPVDMEGTYPLPEAQLDRFLVRLVLGYPEEDGEIAMLKAYDTQAPTPREILGIDELLQLQALTDRVHAEEEIYRYAVSLCRATRENRRVLLGASPRASLALLHASKAQALLCGRPYVTPDDVKTVYPAIISHRLILVPELEGSEDAREQVVQDALKEVPYSLASF